MILPSDEAGAAEEPEEEEPDDEEEPQLPVAQAEGVPEVPDGAMTVVPLLASPPVGFKTVTPLAASRSGAWTAATS